MPADTNLLLVNRIVVVPSVSCILAQELRTSAKRKIVDDHPEEQLAKQRPTFKMDDDPILGT